MKGWAHNNYFKLLITYLLEEILWLCKSTCAMLVAYVTDNKHNTIICIWADLSQFYCSILLNGDLLNNSPIPNKPEPKINQFSNSKSIK